MDDLLVVNQNTNQSIPGEVLRFDDETGALVKRTVPALLTDGSSNPNAPGAPRGMVVWNNKIFVADITDDPNNLVQGSVREYSGAGRLILPLMKAPADQIDPNSFHPRAVVIGLDGLLYVSNAPNLAGPNGHVLRFDPARRTFIDKFVANEGSMIGGCTKNLNRPEGLVFGPDGRLYVTTFRANGNDATKLDTDASTRSTLTHPEPSTALGPSRRLFSSARRDTSLCRSAATGRTREPSADTTSAPSRSRVSCL
jgi:sugar lactone lactonase YvrE